MKRYILVGLAVLIAGCQTKLPSVVDKSAPIKSSRSTHQSDGPPKGPLPSKFKEVKPVYEPLSRYGNPDVYHVNGQHYQVLTSTKGYKARGLASWYGTKFHRKRTSSGEKYDMYALTAAHKTLPIPCYVKVSNLDNGRNAIVKVNDRGPFHQGRVIDLSYAAAAKLGLFPKGTARVEIQALELKKSGFEHKAQYYVQAGAFTSKQLAELMRGKLVKLTRIPISVEFYQHRYIVRVGPFLSRNATERFKSILLQHGITGSFALLI